ncbi:MAG TPA: hypothetical protein PK509_09295 [Catalimonadaceae bacterium]|nr:hypothetical protein [Catalimonadaceae bacterium]
MKTKRLLFISILILHFFQSHGQSIRYNLESASPRHKYAARLGIAPQAPFALMVRAAGDYKITPNLWVEAHSLLPALAFGDANDKIKNGGKYFSAGAFFGLAGIGNMEQKVILSQSHSTSSSRGNTYNSTRTSYFKAKDIPTFSFAGLRGGIFSATVAHNVNTRMARIEQTEGNAMVADSEYVGKVMASSSGIYLGIGWGYERDDKVKIDGESVIHSRYITRSYFDFLYLPSTQYGHMLINGNRFAPVPKAGVSQNLMGARIGVEMSRAWLNYGAELGFTGIFDKKSRGSKPIFNATGFAWINLFAGICIADWK